MKKPVVTYVLVIYMEGVEGYTLKQEFKTSVHGDVNALALAKEVGLEYNKRGHDFVIYKETIEPVNYVISDQTKELVANE